MQTIHISEMSLPLGIFFRVMQCWKPHSWISFFCFCFFPGFIKYISFLPYFYAYCDPSKILCTNTEFSCLMKELICIPIILFTNEKRLKTNFSCSKYHQCYFFSLQQKGSRLIFIETKLAISWAFRTAIGVFLFENVAKNSSAASFSVNYFNFVLQGIYSGQKCKKVQF